MKDDAGGWGIVTVAQLARSLTLGFDELRMITRLLVIKRRGIARHYFVLVWNKKTCVCVCVWGTNAVCQLVAGAWKESIHRGARACTADCRVVKKRAQAALFPFVLNPLEKYVNTKWLLWARGPFVHPTSVNFVFASARAKVLFSSLSLSLVLWPVRRSARQRPDEWINRISACVHQLVYV